MSQMIDLVRSRLRAPAGRANHKGSPPETISGLDIVQRHLDAEKMSRSGPRRLTRAERDLHPELASELDRLQLHRCVLAVVESGPAGLDADKQLSRAFAICTASLQRSGYLQPGTAQPTLKGRRRSIEMAREGDALTKEREYQSLLVDARRARAKRRGRGAGEPPSRLEVGLQRSRRGAANRAAPGCTRAWVMAELKKLRAAMEPVFSCETVFGTCTAVPSAGHCFMAALAVQDILGGEILHGVVDLVPHYWNRVGRWEVDLTGDQFGQAKVQIKEGHLRNKNRAVYPRKRYAGLGKINAEPMKIYRKFRKRLVQELTEQGLPDYIGHLERMK
jgi:hypothetical protein